VTPVDARQRARRGEGDRLRGEILAAAEELLIETADESAVSIRAIAERVGVSAPSIYRHFADKDTLILSVVEIVFRRLDDALESAAAGATDPFDEIQRKGRAYVAFGLEHPEHYRLLFMCKGELKQDMALDGPSVVGRAAFDHLQETVVRLLAMAEPGTPTPDPFAMTCAVWTGVHGVTSLRIAMPFFPWPPVEEQLRLMAEPWRAVLCPSGRPAAPATADSAGASGSSSSPGAEASGSAPPSPSPSDGRMSA
jgi:AcrR family transcriptional regulator